MPSPVNKKLSAVWCIQKTFDPVRGRVYSKVMLGATLPSLKATAMRDGAAEALRRALLEGKFQPGEDLSEVALAQQLEISRGPVREALLVLAQEGLLVHRQNRGFSVLEFTDEDRKAINDVRLPLEARALELAREH